MNNFHLILKALLFTLMNIAFRRWTSEDSVTNNNNEKGEIPSFAQTEIMKCQLINKPSKTDKLKDIFNFFSDQQCKDITSNSETTLVERTPPSSLSSSSQASVSLGKKIHENTFPELLHFEASLISNSSKIIFKERKSQQWSVN